MKTLSKEYTTPKFCYFQINCSESVMDTSPLGGLPGAPGANDDIVDIDDDF